MRYTVLVLRRIGSGSGGVVVRAEDKVRGTPVAIKLGHVPGDEFGDSHHEQRIMMMLATTPNLSTQCVINISIYQALIDTHCTGTSVNYSVLWSTTTTIASYFLCMA